MRAFTGDTPDVARGAAAITEALACGITVFDTARAYGDSERTLGRVLRERDMVSKTRVVTKGGMEHEGRMWRPDGRARTLLADCDASLEALGGVPIDAYLVHAPDKQVAWATTIRALARIADQKLAKHIGVCNVNRRELDEAVAIAPIAVVQVEINAGLRSGVVARCVELGIEVIAHSPFGGPRRSTSIPRDPTLRAIAERHGVSPYAVVLAMQLGLDPCITPIPGATRPETVRDCARAVSIRLDAADLGSQRGVRAVSVPTESDTEVVLLMGLQGSGKSTKAADYVARGYTRLNRDERGGTLQKLNAKLGELLASGTKHVVLDNTYTTRAMRFDVIRVAHDFGARVHGVWIETSLEDAQVNVIERMLAAHGRLLEPAEMERSKDPTSLSPNVLYRTMRALERPSADEGFSKLEIMPFTRTTKTGSRGAQIEVQPCPHESGPLRCWCRPPLPGLLLAYAKANDVDLAESEIIGTSPLHAKMAAVVGARYSQRR